MIESATSGFKNKRTAKWICQTGHQCRARPKSAERRTTAVAPTGPGRDLQSKRPGVCILSRRTRISRHSLSRAPRNAHIFPVFYDLVPGSSWTLPVGLVQERKKVSVESCVSVEDREICVRSREFSSRSGRRFGLDHREKIPRASILLLWSGLLLLWSGPDSRNQV